MAQNRPKLQLLHMRIQRGDGGPAPHPPGKSQVICNCSVFCCTFLYVHFSIAIILMGKRELIALLNLSSWCLVMVEQLFLTVPRGCLQIVIVVFPDHTHLLFFIWASLDIIIRTPPPPWKMLEPLDPWKSIVFSVIKLLDPPPPPLYKL